MIAMAEIDLLSAVQPTGGWTAIVGIKAGRVRQKFADTLEGAETLVADFAKDGCDVYFGTAKYKTPESRTKENIQGLKSLWVDIDCGDDKQAPKGYQDQAAGMFALQKFLSETGLPKPLLVNSGRGFHAYWVLDEELPRAEWEPLSERLRHICVTREFYVDTSVFEAARIMRVPNTKNHKDSPPKDVSIVSGTLPPPVSVEWICGVLGVDRSSPVEQPLTPPSKRNLTSLGKALTEGSISLFSKIMLRGANGSGCQQLVDAYTNRATLSEPRWFDALSIAKFCEDCDDAIHKMSAGHPGYDPISTEGKIQHIVGPHTCTEFEKHNPGGCYGCPLQGTIKSPIQLGRDYERATEADNEVIDEVSEEAHTIPAYPEPYFRGRKGGVYLNPKTEEDAPLMVYEHDLYVVKRMNDPNLGEVVVMKLHLPKDGVKQFIVPNAVVADKSELRKTLARQGVVCPSKLFPLLMEYVIASTRNLQFQKKAEQMRTQFGWADNNTKFILGDREITASGVFHSPPSSVTESTAENLQQEGTLEKWKQVMSLYGTEGHEPFAFAALTGFGAPLFKFLGQNGAIINVIHPRSGTGKTTILRMCNSIYGHPQKLCATWQDTLNAKMFRLGVMNNLPYSVDEITNMLTRDFSTLAYAISQGSGKDRMKSSTNELRVNHASWQTIALCSSNASFNQKLSSEKASPEGELMRLLEYKINYQGTSPIPTEHAKLMFDHQLMENYGHAGEPYIEYLLQNMENVLDTLKGVQIKIDRELKLTQRERFWSAVLAANITGGLVAKQLGLIDWDMKKIYQWATSMITEMREDVKPPASEPVTSVGSFLNSHINNILVVDDKAHGGSKFTPLPTLEPRGELVVRYEPDTKLMFIDVRIFRSWCVEHQIDYKEVMHDLKDGGVFLGNRNKRLSKGMQVAGPAVNCIVLDTDTADFIDVDNLVDASMEEEELQGAD